MNVLFYVNPSITNSDPLFFLGAVNAKLIPLAETMVDIGYKVSLLIPEAIRAHIKTNSNINIHSVKNNEFVRETGVISEFDYEVYAHNDSNAIDGAAKLVKGILTEDPDLIVLWECTSDHLKKAYPKATILSLMPGFLGRLPYPDTIFYDTNGLFKKSKIYTDLEKILSAIKVDPDQWRCIEKISSDCNAFYSSMKTIQSTLSSMMLEAEVESFELVPLQFSKHYNFRADTKYKNQTDFIFDCIEKADSTQGLLFTQYITNTISEAPMSEKMVHYFNSHHRNIMFNPEFNSIDNISQYLLPFADSVRTCSSSIGLQALLYNKPVTCMGDTFISRLVEHAKADEENRKKILIYLLFHASVTWEKLSDKSFLKKFVTMIMRSKAGIPKSLTSIHPTYSRHLQSSMRYKRAAEKAGNVVRSEKSIDYISPTIMNAINDAKLVSFDIFDTLIERPLAQPADLFLIVELKNREKSECPEFPFAEARQRSEQIAKSRLAEGSEEVTLDDIYLAMRDLFGLTARQAESLKQLELKTEMDLMVVRPVGSSLFEYCLKNKKKIVYASDMYLSKDFIASLLTKCGYPVDEKLLYVSSFYGKKKRTGSLFELIAEQENVKFSEQVHFGDNSIGDLSVPKSYGIKAFRITRSIDKMRNHVKFKNAFTYGGGTRSLAESAQAYLIARKLFDNPFSQPKNDSHFNGSAFNLGYCGFGPTLFGFTSWLHSRFLLNGNDSAYFIARDGKIVKEVYDILYGSQGVSTTYAYGSRRMLRNSYQPSLSEFYSTVGRVRDTNPSLVLEKIYGWKTSNPHLNKMISDDSDEIIAYKELRSELPKLVERNNKQSTLLIRYCEQIGFLQSHKPAIVEIGYAGTIQDGFWKATQKPTDGYYFILLDTAASRISGEKRMEGYTGNLVERTRHWHPINHHGFMFETLFCSTESTIVGLDDVDGRIFAIRDHNADDVVRRAVVREIHYGARSYASDIRSFFGEYLNFLKPDAALEARLLSDFIYNPAASDAVIFQGVIFANNFKEGTYRYVVPPCPTDEIDTAVWKQGALAVKNANKNKPTDKKTPTLLESPQESLIREPFNKSDEERRPAWERKLVGYFTKKNRRKVQKYMTSRKRFFIDSKNPFLRAYGKALK